MRIYVGNLADQVTDEDLKAAFSAHGNVDSSVVIKDRFSGRSRGFGFVEIADDTAARTAISNLNGTELKGQAIAVNQARERQSPAGGSQGGRPGFNKRGAPPRHRSSF